MRIFKNLNLNLTEDFIFALKFTLKEEGVDLEDESITGEVNDPNDRGGYTKYGISSKAHPDRNIKDSNLEQAIEWYYTDYWVPFQGWEHPRYLAAVLFDTGVHCGVSSVNKWLQQAIHEQRPETYPKSEIDGIIGKNTIKELKLCNTNVTAQLVISRRLARFAYLAHKDKSQLRYMEGWTNRVSRLMKLSIK